MPGGREVVLAGAERRGDLGAVRLVADRDDGVAGALDRSEHVVGTGARREPLVDPELGARRLRDRSGRLPRAQQRARQHELRLQRHEPLAQLPRLLATALAQRP